MKYHGAIGFAITAETIVDNQPTGVWDTTIVEKTYYGDFLKKSYRWNKTENLNPDLDVTNEISIISDSFMKANYGTMRYATLSGIRWSISSAEIDYPRIRLSLGGVYNGPTPGSA